jgi:hypothetical protein
VAFIVVFCPTTDFWSGWTKEPLINSVSFHFINDGNRTHQRSFFTGVDFARNMPTMETRYIGLSGQQTAFYAPIQGKSKIDAPL